MTITFTLDQIGEAAREFAAHMGDRRLFAFYGSMGAGKTTFIRALCAHLGVTDVVASPTFAIVSEYRTVQQEPVYHFDFYRIKNIREALNIGCEEYFFSGHLCLMEWPDLVSEILPEETVSVTLRELADGSREISMPD